MKKNLFDFWITRPIKEKLPHGLNRLGLLIKGTCLRRTKKMIELSHPLPDRREKTTWVELTPKDRKLYSFFEKEAANIASGSYRYNGHPNPNDRQNNNILKLINFLRLICDHGEELLPQSAREIWSTDGDKVIDWQSFQELQVALVPMDTVAPLIRCGQMNLACTALCETYLELCSTLVIKFSTDSSVDIV